MKILISDANLHNRRNLASFLLAEGMNVIGEAASTRETLVMTRARSADIVILDSNFTHLISALLATQKAPKIILLMTSHDAALEEEGLEAGAFACLAKNDGVDPIINTIQNIHLSIGEKS